MADHHRPPTSTPHFNNLKVTVVEVSDAGSPRTPPVQAHLPSRWLSTRLSTSEESLGPRPRAHTHAPSTPAAHSDGESDADDGASTPSSSTPARNIVRRMASSFRLRRRKSASPQRLHIGLPFNVVHTNHPLYRDAPVDMEPSGASSSRLAPPEADEPSSGGSRKHPPPSPKFSGVLPKLDGIRKPSQGGGVKDSLKGAPDPMSARESKKPPHLLVPAGATLESLAASPSDPIPPFIRTCVEFIETHGGLNLEGIYRVPGNRQQVAYLEAQFFENPEVSLTELELPINAVATAIKNFLAALPEPLIPTGIFDNVVKALSTGRDEAGKVDSIRRVLGKLSPGNRAVLAYFTAHLRKVASHAHVNSMDYRNLAKCFWPTLLRPHFDNFEMMAQLTSRLEEFTHLLLNYSATLLGEPDEP